MLLYRFIFQGSIIVCYTGCELSHDLSMVAQQLNSMICCASGNSLKTVYAKYSHRFVNLILIVYRYVSNLRSFCSTSDL